jgi:hypothetical protein
MKLAIPLAGLVVVGASGVLWLGSGAGAERKSAPAAGASIR